jgi:hypothetical protein
MRKNIRTLKSKVYVHVSKYQQYPFISRKANQLPLLARDHRNWFNDRTITAALPLRPSGRENSLSCFLFLLSSREQQMYHMWLQQQGIVLA